MPSWLPSFVLRIILSIAGRFPAVAGWISNKMVQTAVTICRNRPHPWSTVSPYTSWVSLTDTTWSARHLPPVELPDLPPEDAVVELFARPEGGEVPCAKSTCLFPAFAQYLTDGFIRTRMPHSDEPETLRLRNTSNHQIDLCPLYGRTAAQTDALRLKSDARGERGRLRSQIVNSEEYAPFHYRPDGTVEPRFAALDEPLSISNTTPELKAQVFAFGGDRANASPQVAMINTLLLREHNRLAGLIEHDNPSWDDERVFQVTRNTLIVIFIKIVVEDYINHITPSPFRFSANPIVAYTAHWNRPNWITTEFSLLYRWHSLLPDRVRWGGTLIDLGVTPFANHLLMADGLLKAFTEFGGEPATRLGAFNTPRLLLPVEKATVRQARLSQVATLADYRAYAGMHRPRDFADVTKDTRRQKLLKALYSTPDRIEFFPGMMSEDTVANSPLPPLILRMVAVDAFSQALTNPLLSEHVFNPQTFSDVGWNAIRSTSTLAQLVDRNVAGGARDARISMTRSDWSYAW